MTDFTNNIIQAIYEELCQYEQLPTPTITAEPYSPKTITLQNQRNKAELQIKDGNLQITFRLTIPGINGWIPEIIHIELADPNFDINQIVTKINTTIAYDYLQQLDIEELTISHLSFELPDQP